MPPNPPPNSQRPQQPARGPPLPHIYDPRRVQPLPPGYLQLAPPNVLGHPPPGPHSFSAPGPPTQPRIYHHGQPQSMPGYAHELPRATQPVAVQALTQTIMSTISGVLERHQNRHESMGNSMQAQINELSKNVQKLESSLAEVAQLLKRSNDMQQRATQAVASRILELERVVRGKRTPDSYGNNMSIMDKLDSISYTIDDLLERAQDPQANLDSIVRHEAATDPIPEILRQEKGTSPMPEVVQEPQVQDDPPGSRSPPSSSTQYAESSRSVSCALEGTDTSGRTLCTLSPVDRTKDAAAKGYSSPSPPSCLVPEEPSRARSASSSPILVDGTHDTNDTGTLPNDQFATPTNYSPHPAPNPGSPSLPSPIDPDDDLLNFEPDDASTPAPLQQPSRPTTTTDVIPSSRTQTPEADDHVPSSRTPSPFCRVSYPIVQTPGSVFDTQSQVTVDHDDEEVERMINAPTPSMTTIESPERTPQKLQLPIGHNFLDDDEMSELSSLSSEESEAPEPRPKTPNTEVKQEPSSFARRGSARKAKESSTSTPSSTKKRKKRSSGANDQPRKRRKRADAGKPRKKIVWPEKVEADCRNMIECDGCQKWFHYGCVGMNSDEIVLLNDQNEFICPALDQVGTQSSPGCARPDCADSPPDEFFVDKLIGRKTASLNDNCPTYQWLIRWMGYAVCHATWEFKESFGDEALIEQFHCDAENEGLDDDGEVCILLAEAVNGGWDPEKPDMKPPDLGEEERQAHEQERERLPEH
ncbi:hypothetical protein PQX77_008053 [Marasmius sp. AFHP31]|nr:hypothetical protein PQX77_008053 [Marasmius sp. AFHP31]